MGRLAGALALNPVLGNSHAAYIMIHAIEAAAKGRDGAKSTKLTTIISLFDLPPDIHDNAERHFAIQLGLYQKYFRATEAVAHDNGVKSAFFLQPIPAWGKTLTEAEKRVAGDLAYGTTYRRIVAGMMALGEHGLPIYDLGNVFQNQAGTIYADHIHSLTDLEGQSPGNRLLAARIGELLAESWRLQRKPGASGTGAAGVGCCRSDVRPAGDTVR